MREVVLLGILLVWWSRIVGTSSFFDGAADYWYSNDDGVILDSLAPSANFRSRDNKEDKNISNNSHVARNSYNARRKYSTNNWTFEFDDDGAHTLNDVLSFLRTADAPTQKLLYNSKIERIQNLRTPEEIWHCIHGPRKKLGSCNYCVCFGGQLYLCTARACPTRNNAGIQVYIPYRENYNGACIEGEHIQSFDCNRCWCSAGQVMCTVKTCSKPAKKRNRLCTPGESQRSVDGCNTCGCNLRGELYCTANTCHNKPKQDTELASNGCIPNTWYSLESSKETHCKECYCLSGDTAVCFMKLCRGSLHPQHGYRLPLRLSAAIKNSKCLPGTKKSDHCTKCTCTVKREWKCYTRLKRKCSDYGMKLDLKAKLNQQVRLKSRVSAEHQSTEEKNLFLQLYDDEDEVKAAKEQERIRREKERKEREERKRQERERQERERQERERERKRKERERQEQEREEEQKKKDNLFPLEPIKPTEPITESESGETLTTTEKTTTRRPPGPFTTTPRFDGHIPPGAQCARGEAFTLGTKRNCQGCFCTAAGRWRCYSVRSPCRGFVTDQSSCSRRVTYEKNPEVNCSICSCGQTGSRMCFTDETCAQKILKTNCDAVVCSDRCRNARWAEGFCHQDKCYCL